MSRSETTGPVYRAAVAGLGQIGNLFDDDPKRREVWTHAGAYLALPQVRLVAGADPDEGRRRRFAERCAGAVPYRDYRDLLAAGPLDLLSICSPTALHHRMVLDGVRAGVRAIFCEKPLAATVEEAADMVRACEAAGVVLAVNHTRRWEGVYRRARRLLAEGEIGDLHAVAGWYPGKVFTMGTHLFDLLRFFAGDVAWVCGDDAATEGDEPGPSGFLRFRSGVQGSVIAGRDRTNHLFELDLMGSRGRLRLSGDGGRLDLWRFEESPRYSGYRELAPVSLEAGGEDRPAGRLVAAVADLVACLETGAEPACTGRDGLAAVEIAWALCGSAARGGAATSLPIARIIHDGSSRPPVANESATGTRAVAKRDGRSGAAREGGVLPAAR